MKKLGIDIITILPTFLATVEFLVNTNIKGRPLVAYSPDGSFLNFRVVSFKTALEKNITVPDGQEKDGYIKMYMQTFRDLGLTVSRNNRLTNISWIDGKTSRAITVKKDAYMALLKLKEDIKSG